LFIHISHVRCIATTVYVKKVSYYTKKKSHL
jgi:hypothetical protein